jgi:hypothetical protein
MNSLNIPSTRLYPAQMPENFPHPRNTSLDISLLKRLTKIEPLPVHAALTQTIRNLRSIEKGCFLFYPV